MRRRASLLVVPLYGLATLLLTWPLVLEMGRSLPTLSGRIDPLLQAFLVGWDLKALPTDPLHVFAVPIFHPEPRALAFMDTMIGEAVLAAPVAALSGNLALAYNFLVMASFVLSAWAVYRLTRILGIGRGGAWLAGFLFAFAPYRMSNLSNLNLLHTEFLALGVWFLLAFRARRRARHVWAVAAAFVAQCYFGWYYAAFFLVVIFVFAVHGALAGWWRRDLRALPWRSAFLAAAMAALLVLPVAIPYLAQRRAMPEYRRTLEQSILYSADVLDYARTNPGNRLARITGRPTAGLGLWPGLATMALAAIGLIDRRRASSTGPSTAARHAGIGSRLRARVGRWGEAGFALALGATAFALSLGPVLQIAGRPLPVPLPYRLLFEVVPGFQGQRAPSRFGVLVLLALVVLAAYGFEACRRRAMARGRSGRALFGVVAVIGTAELVSIPVGFVRLPDRGGMPTAYRWLARQPGDFAFLELPAPASEARESVTSASRQVYALYHGKRIVDGVSGFAPPPVERLRALVQDFPAPAGLRAAAERDTRYILVHYAELDPERRATWRARAARAPDLRERASFGEDVVYELAPRPQVSKRHPG